MAQVLRLFLAYFQYWLRARDEHSLHSPFLYALYTQVIRSRQDWSDSSIEQLRRQLMASKQRITITDLGAGSRLTSARQRLVGDIARTSAKPAKYAQLLNRLTAHVKAGTVLDLGTSLGLTTAYLAKAAAIKGGQVFSFEGCPATAALAREHLTQLGLTNVSVIVGNLDQTLQTQLDQLARVDLAFFDANHRYTPTIHYFTHCLLKIHNDTVFIFDDIHWSNEMEQAWHDIQQHPLVTVTVDLFGVGLVFFRQEQPKQHFVLRF